mmetsp:Transcript_10692/g.23510  ORF Transcript_10692/g.23510 Transcript_10692/m.23510 type:complete len:246 (-) Transcript_10692:82-819(-)
MMATIIEFVTSQENKCNYVSDLENHEKIIDRVYNSAPEDRPNFHDTKEGIMNNVIIDNDDALLDRESREGGFVSVNINIPKIIDLIYSFYTHTDQVDPPNFGDSTDKIINVGETYPCETVLDHFALTQEHQSEKKNCINENKSLHKFIEENNSDTAKISRLKKTPPILFVNKKINFKREPDLSKIEKREKEHQQAMNEERSESKYVESIKSLSKNKESIDIESVLDHILVFIATPDQFQEFARSI